MAWQTVSRPYAETYQNNVWNTNGRYRGANQGPRRSAPVELPFRVQRGGKWYEGDRRIHGFEAPMYFVRPHDGKRRGHRGRLMDAMTGEGPDVFVMKCGDMRCFHRDRPQRWQWSGWRLSKRQKDDLRLYDKDFRSKDLHQARNFWPSSGAKRGGQIYDYLGRRYRDRAELNNIPRRYWVRDMRWEDGARRSDRSPLSFQDGNRQWYSRVPSNAGYWPGGRPRNA